MKFAMLLFAIMVILQPVGQILEKKGMNQIGAITGISSLFNVSTLTKIITNPWVVLGVFCSALGLILWLAVLSNMKVSYIYPLGSISYIVVAVLAMIFLGESMTWIRMGGICLIVSGCFLINV